MTNVAQPTIGNYRWVICALLFFATTINYVDRAVLGVLEPTLRTSLGWTQEKQSLATFYCAIVLFGLGAQLTGFFPVTVAVVNWFERRRARALSTMSIGFAVGGVIVPLVAF